MSGGPDRVQCVVAAMRAAWVSRLDPRVTRKPQALFARASECCGNISGKLKRMLQGY